MTTSNLTESTTQITKKATTGIAASQYQFPRTHRVVPMTISMRMGFRIVKRTDGNCSSPLHFVVGIRDARGPALPSRRVRSALPAAARLDLRARRHLHARDFLARHRILPDALVDAELHDDDVLAVLDHRVQLGAGR